MNLSELPFSNLPFNKLFQDYTLNYDKLSSFFRINPFSEDDINKALHSFEFSNDREKTVTFLKNFNQKYGAGEKTIQSIEKLRDEQSIAVVTGQQLTLFGGPLFTIYKIITAIHYAKKWEKEAEIPCIPVFWLADEDHDFEEIATVGFPIKDDFKQFAWNNDSEIGKRVSEITLESNFELFKNQVIESQFDTDFTYQLCKILDESYNSGNSVGEAFARFILNLFEDYGLILAGSADPSIKKYLSDSLVTAAEGVEKLYDSLKRKTDDLLSEGYHGQVHLQPSNLFWIDDENKRVKLSYKNDIWSTEENRNQWNTGELIQDIQSNSERFSPNVFLRPILQNELLPAFTYIAGPGEISYHAQMKEFFDGFDQQMPLLMPRFSITMVESGIDRILEKLPFEIPAYNERIEDLDSQFIEHSDSPDIESIFDLWKREIEDISEQKIQQIKEIEPTLEGTSEKAKAVFFTELDKLKGKLYRSVKEQEKTQLKRIRKIKTNLFPNDNLQEREVAFVYMMNKYGLDIWDQLLQLLENQSTDTHKIIRL